MAKTGATSYYILLDLLKKRSKKSRITSNFTYSVHGEPSQTQRYPEAAFVSKSKKKKKEALFDKKVGKNEK